MRKKIVGIVVCMLLISSTMTMVLFSDTGKVEASGGGQQGGGCVNLDYDFVWNMTNQFGNVIHDVNWSENGGNGIPKGRAWATAGENYTIVNILEKHMKGVNNTCGLTGCRNLTIGPLQSNLSRKYSNKIVINNYNLTIKKNGHLPKEVPISELFPIGVGCLRKDGDINYLNQTFTFTNAEIIEKKIYDFEYIQDHCNVSCELLNNYRYIVGPVVYLDTADSVPENHDCIFILNEEPASEEKLNTLSGSMGCILIENASKNYTFQNSEQYNYAISRLNGTDTNFSSVLEEIKSGSDYVVENFQNTTTLVFSNMSNYSCFPLNDYVIIVQFEKEGGSDFFPLRTLEWGYSPRCKGLIISNYLDGTHWMTHAVRDWHWFLSDAILPDGKILGYYTNRYPLPVFCMNRTLGADLIENKSCITVNGNLTQVYRQQNDTTPGVNSSNVVAYRNISTSPGFPITVLSNRMDGYWSEAPGDSGVGGAILLGIAKYFNDYNITPKYNLHFLFTTGEEYGMRGAQHYVDSHNNKSVYNFTYFIGFDQLGFNYTITQNGTHCLEPHTNNDTIALILKIITDHMNYKKRTGYDCKINNMSSEGAEDYVWNQTGVNTILLEKGGDWDGHHQTGDNFTKGDSLANIDRNDVNVTFELAWNITKYFTVNPNCWFENLNFTAYDSPNDGDNLLDSIQANFSISSILPSDRVRVDSVLLDQDNEEVASSYRNYIISNQESTNSTIVLTLPPTIAQESCKLQLRLYNSTGWINKIVNINDLPNETQNSSYFRLYHPFGNPNIGFSHASTEDMIRGSYFTVNEYGIARNITAYVQTNTSEAPAHSICMIYRKNDSALIGKTEEILPTTGENPQWMVYNFTAPYPILQKNTEYVLTCWSDAPCNLYYDLIYDRLFGRFENLTYGHPPDPAQWNDTTDHKLYSIYCSYTPDVTPPQITGVNANPSVVGFGYNVTITTNVTDECSGINQVKVEIGYPGGKSGNFTMTHCSNDTYHYLFTDTWLVGQYNYTVWAADNASNINSSIDQHFNVSAHATISIATLQDCYTGEEYINITDPPIPLENYTVVARGLTWDKYYDATMGQNILEIFTGPVNYQDNGTWMPINNTLSQLASDHPAYVYGYRTGNDRGLFGAYFKTNAQQEWPVAFTFNKSDDPTVHVIRSKLVGVGYVDPQSDWAYQYLQNVQSSQGQTNNYSITYPGVFTGTDVTWTYGNTGLKEEIILSNITKTVLQNHPPSQYGLNNASSYLVFITKLDYQNLNLYNGSGVLDGNVTISDAGVEFRDVLGQFRCALPLGEAYELNNESMRQKLTYRIIHLNGITYLLSGLKITDLNAMTFPVVIDPTLTVVSSISDGFIEKSSTSYTTAWTASTGTVSDTVDFITIGQYKFKTTYYIYRGFVHFNTSSLPSNAYVDNATLSLYKRTDYSTTDFDITIQNGQPTYPHDPLQSSDYNKSQYSGNGGTLNTAGFTSGYNPITLTNLTWINTTGITKLCLRSSRDISGTAPTGYEFVSVYSREFIFSYPPKLVIYYRNQSKIENTGETGISGYLLMQVQYYNETLESWIVDNDTVNETSPRTITSGNQLALDTIFNGQVRASDLMNGPGLYRVYAAFRDPEGSILKTNDETDLEAWWQFNKT